MDLLRTPDERFADLPEFPFSPHYVDVDDDEGGTLRVHHLDEGPADGPVVLLMHGEPSWCYLYRRMVGPLTSAGLRVVAPDLVGFGRSDKPTRQQDHTYARHVEWMRQALFDRLALREVTLVGQDWGGLVGLRLVAEHPDRFARLVVANTGLPTGLEQMPDAFRAWQKFAREAVAFPVGQIVAGGCVTPLLPEVVAAYEAPFPDDSYQAGPRAMPSLVPTASDDPATGANQRAWEVLRAFERPVVTAFSDQDPITAGGERAFQYRIPGAQGQPHATITGAGHFLQEDRGPELAEVVLSAVRAG